MSIVNISPINVQGKCDNKCVYEYDYPDTNLIATNIGTLIMLKVDNAPAPVIYNNEKYTVGEIFISTPSVHLFNNSPSNAEILIHHDCESGGPKLIVCMPIKASSNSSSGTVLLTDIINMVASNAPRSGETTEINISDFTLNNIVAKKPFYSYSGNDMRGAKSNFIVYGVIDAIPLNTVALSSLSNIITANSIKAEGSGVYYNSSGPGKKNDDGIYISCKPTGSSSDETTVTTSSNNNSSDSLWNNPSGKTGIIIAISLVMFFILFSMLNYIYIYATST
tara:strand:- start:9732 stop:10568 length:837 start_codon:yes stop_codon:yes gene_type:complete